MESRFKNITKGFTCLDTLTELYEFVVIFLSCIENPFSDPEIAAAIEIEHWNWDPVSKVLGLASKLQKRDMDVYKAYKLADYAIKNI